MRTLIVSILAFLAASTSFAVVVIDDFTEGTSSYTSTGQQSAWDNSNINVLGGIRNGSVGCESSDTDGTTKANIQDGHFEVTTNKKASPSIYLGYDATAGWGTDLDTDPFNGAFSSAVDLTQSGLNNSFAITFSYASGTDTVTPFFNDFLFTVQIAGVMYTKNVGFNGDGTANIWMAANYTDLNNEISATFLVPFSELNGTPNMSQVEAFSLHICSENKNSEYTLDSITAAVPEPASALMIAFGGGLIALVRRFYSRI